MSRVPRRPAHAAAGIIPGIIPGLVALAIAGCSPAPDAVQGEDGKTMPQVTAERLAGTQDYARARADAVEVDAGVAAQVERVANTLASAEACGESTADAERELGAVLDAAGLDAEGRATMEALSDATIAQANAERRGDAGCD